MKFKLTLSLALVVSSFAFGQKKSLDHSVYDAWQNIGARSISNNGQWTAYNVDPQEGDSHLYLQKTDNSKRLFKFGSGRDFRCYYL